MNCLLALIEGRPRLRLLVRAYAKSREDRAKDMAAGLAFYSLFSLFPLLVGVIGAALYFVDVDALEAWATPSRGALFPGSTGLVAENIAALVRLRTNAGLLGAVGLL